jgi:hypothetical protein
MDEIKVDKDLRIPEPSVSEPNFANIATVLVIIATVAIIVSHLFFK